MWRMFYGTLQRMTTLDEAKIVFKQALVYLEQAVWRSTKGRKFVDGFGGYWTVANEDGSLVACDVVHGGDADLIALMYNVLPAQIALLEVASTLSDVESPVFQAALRVAKTIVK